MTPNPSLERDLHRHGTWPAKRSGLSCASRAKRHPGSGPSAQTLGVMAKNLLDLRFVVQRDDQFRSSPWRLWITQPGDLYLTTRRMGGIQKYSFHVSGVCRSAFTQEHGAPAGMPDRLVFKWKRASTPTVGTGGASRVAWIAFPTDYLSRSPEPKARTLVIAAAPAAGAAYIEVGYTRESQSFVMDAFKGNLRQLHCYTALPNGEAIFVSSYHSDWENKDLNSPAAQGSVIPDLLCSASDPEDTGRPYRLLFGPTPNDGDALVLRELGCYRAKQ